jgi:hypothetical protein
VNREPEAFEFSSSNIDETADIVVQAGSSLPDMKAARIQSMVDLYKSGLLGDPMDPEVSRRALQKLEMSDVTEAFDQAKEDEDEAQAENIKFDDNEQPAFPEFFQNHQIHYRVHTSKLKSPETRKWPREKRLAFIAHLLKHVEYINPQSALQLAQEYQILDILKPSTLALLNAPPPAPPGQEPRPEPK